MLRSTTWNGEASAPSGAKLEAVLSAPSTGSPTALVTGASRGIGFEIARALVAAGAPVALAARGRPDLEAARERLLAEFSGAKLRVIEMDVAEPRSIEAAHLALEVFEAEVGPLGWLVCNAGMAKSAPLLPKHPPAGDLYAEHLAVNFHGPRRLLEVLGPAMVARGSGAVVNVASSAGLVGYAYVAAYCASKHALIGFTRAAALELKSTGLRVSALCPHYVDSPMLAASIDNLVAKTGRTPEDARAFFAAQNPGGRLVTPAQVAAACLALLRSGRTGIVRELDGTAERDVDPGVQVSPKSSSNNQP